MWISMHWNRLYGRSLNKSYLKLRNMWVIKNKLFTTYTYLNYINLARRVTKNYYRLLPMDIRRKRLNQFVPDNFRMQIDNTDVH